MELRFRCNLVFFFTIVPFNVTFKDMNRIDSVAMLQLRIMNHRFILDDKVQAGWMRRMTKGFWPIPWLSLDRRLQFGRYDQLK